MSPPTRGDLYLWAYCLIFLWGCPPAWIGGDFLRRWFASSFTSSGGMVPSWDHLKLPWRSTIIVGFPPCVSPGWLHIPGGHHRALSSGSSCPSWVPDAQAVAHSYFFLHFCEIIYASKNLFCRVMPEAEVCFSVFMFYNFATTSQTILHNSGDTEFFFSLIFIGTTLEFHCLIGYLLSAFGK